MKLEKFAEHDSELLDKLILLNENMLELDKKIQSMVENKKWLLQVRQLIAEFHSYMKDNAASEGQIFLMDSSLRTWHSFWLYW